jgi:hypothetical protein
LFQVLFTAATEATNHRFEASYLQRFQLLVKNCDGRFHDKNNNFKDQTASKLNYSAQCYYALRKPNSLIEQQHLNALRKLLFQGIVTLHDADVNSHVIDIELHTAANSAELLNDVVVTRHVTAISEHRSVLYLTVVSLSSVKSFEATYFAKMKDPVASRNNCHPLA